ncbi:MAG: DUF2064 domain-containing protein [Candidatus Zixiibacteriota bacterium]|nr:MAG: DUF2064 domain-containing protein [candidate division Zixibacteria bacterium]
MAKKKKTDSVIAVCIQELTEDGSSMDLGSISGDDLRIVHQAFITDTIRHAFAVPDVDIRLYFINDAERRRLVNIIREYLQSRLQGDFEKRFSVHDMKKERWGLRIEKVFQSCFDGGYRNVLVLGSRTPTVTPDMMSRALRLLRESDAVFGPTPEGRYYVIGMSGSYHVKLSAFDWKSPSIYSEVAGTFTETGLSWSELDIWYPVESMEELEMMARDINQFRFEGDEETAHETELALDHIITKLEP